MGLIPRRGLLGSLYLVVLVDTLLCSASSESDETAVLEELEKTLSPLSLREVPLDAPVVDDSSQSLEEALDGWEVSPELLEELITPTEEKVNLLIDSSIISWTDSHAENVPLEVRKEMVNDLERARELGLRQVRLFNYMVELKGLIDTSKGGDGVYLRDLMKWCKQMFLNVHAAEAKLFLKQEEVRKQFFHPGESSASSLDSRTIYLILRHRADVIVRRFEAYMPEPKEGPAAGAGEKGAEVQATR
ncbi:hypothetical protein, conserved [Eimeria acervulina]|uniref:Uncharacterized protein n=1 Tax=Eimeria acervulina TaxID=5801 RepID=U6GBN5_EIMAC|nr:hypothetical protein, conserved [Eimeria acervulina]CDI76962.1 hypothetical protein, conserved [Eimeria acervulina]